MTWAARASARRLIDSQRSSRGRPVSSIATSERDRRSWSATVYAATIANESAASAGVPLLPRVAAATRTPMTRPMTATLHLVTRFVMEDLLESATEEAGEREGQRQRGQVSTGLDGVDGLARDAERVRELALAEPQALAETAHLVLHAVKLA